MTEVYFEENSALEEIPDTFMLRTGVATITLPDHLKRIGDAAFQECESLTSIGIPATVEEVGESAFKKSGLTSVELSSNLTTIGREAFRESELTNATIDGNDVAICESAFAYTPLTTVSMGDGIASIGRRAFSNCESLATVSLCNDLTTSHLRSIGDEAFSFVYVGTSSLTSIAIPDSVESIGTRAFADPNVSHVWNEERQEPNSGSLKTLTLGSSQEASHLTTIGARAFEGAGIRSVTLPNYLQTMGTEMDYTLKYGVFHECSLLETVVWPTAQTEGCLTTVSGFYGCESLKDEVISTLPAWITTIDDGAFGSCGFENLVIPNTVTHIGRSAFSNLKWGAYGSGDEGRKRGRQGTGEHTART